MKLRSYIFIIGFLFALTGCSSQNKQLENNISNIRIAFGDDGTSMYSFSSRAKILRNELRKIEGVSDANVVITGHTALIGLTVYENDDNEEIGRMKKEAAKIALATDQAVYHTAISTNSEIVDMIADMEKEKNEET